MIVVVSAIIHLTFHKPKFSWFAISAMMRTSDQQALIHAYYASTLQAVNNHVNSNDAYNNGLPFEESKESSSDWMQNTNVALPYFHGNQEFSANLASLEPHSWPVSMSAKATEKAIDELLAAPQQHEQRQQTSSAKVAAPAKSGRTKRSQIFTEVLCHDCDTWPTSTENQLPLLEVNPGFVVRLHGYKETWEACQQNGKTSTTSCPCCSEILRCVKNSEFVLCQGCRFISPVLPLELPPSERIRKPFQVGGGLALGLVSRLIKVEEPQRKTTVASAGHPAPTLTSRRSRKLVHDGGELQTIPEVSHFDVLLPPWCDESTQAT